MGGRWTHAVSFPSAVEPSESPAERVMANSGGGGHPWELCPRQASGVPPAAGTRQTRDKPPGEHRHTPQERRVSFSKDNAPWQCQMFIPGQMDK